MHGEETFLWSQKFFSQSKIQSFMDTNLWPFLEQPATLSHPDSDESVSRGPIPFSKLYFSVILTPTLLSSKRCLFLRLPPPPRTPIKSVHLFLFSSMRAKNLSHPIIFDLIGQKKKTGGEYTSGSTSLYSFLHLLDISFPFN
jgi:hypothetical protein